jgi:predicted nucleic acid-binding protein
VAVVIFDTDVLIGFLGSDDPHHDRAVERIRSSQAPGTRRLLSAVNYTEVLIGPLKTIGLSEVARIDAMLLGLSIETVQIETALAQRAAMIRAQTNLKLPDAYAVATALDAGRDGDEVRIESFDERVVKAFERGRLG